MRSRPTIMDIAARASVSRQTMSCVVNNRGKISDETRARGLAAIEELGRRPSAPTEPEVKPLLEEMLNRQMDGFLVLNPRILIRRSRFGSMPTSSSTHRARRHRSSSDWRFVWNPFISTSIPIVVKIR